MEILRVALLKADRVIEKIQTMICVVLFTAILILGAIQIFGRYVGKIPTPWTEELMRFSMIWLTWIGSALTIRVDGHVSVDILISYIHKHTVRAALFVFARLVCVAFLLAFLPNSVNLIIRSGTSMAASMPIPYSYVYLSVPIGIIMMLLSYAKTIPAMGKQYLKGEK
ncbi:MAG: TRAP transporter small permease [Treponemataceae bacterium]|nr:MAG: TRAP transporter small permease [Treponemataceae bacterium]